MIHCDRIGDIEFAMREASDAHRLGPRGAHQLESHLTSAADDENSHAGNRSLRL
jgi:hypothetical protein